MIAEAKPTPATAKELAAIDAVKAAIKALPKTIYMQADACDGRLDFWKPNTRNSAYPAGTPLQLKSAFNNNRR